ncbi:hypothetical protein BDN72DRAFT_965441 [Pluteus cervinus]|uniref:Uncharacterized protein n=1 Tax=Pluteus cervinus TaxID=181527 RepID=A0ACD3A5I8_9AGAR|nr:hypothetical protein BDN72DRAFT_965441 [Pluteus cervinus]
MTGLLIYSKIRHLFPGFSQLFHVLDILNPLRLVKRRMGSLGQMLLGWFSVTRLGVLDAPKSRLLTLPLEVLTGIVQELSWRDVLRIRQSCRLLGEISKSNPVWRNIARMELLEDFTTGAHELFLERSVEQYKSEELEGLILRWKRAKQNWTIDDGAPPRLRTFEMSFGQVHLIRGGRWLLFTRTTGAVLYLDLDAPGHPSEQILIPERPGLSHTTIALDYLPDSDVLTFNLALAVQQYPEEEEGIDSDSAEYKIQVWRVCLSRRGNNPDCTDRLTAECLTAFRQEPQGSVHSISILGDHIAHTLRYETDHNDLTFLVIVKWVDLIGIEDGFKYPQWVLYLRIDWPSVYLLPGRQVLVYDRGSINLYDSSTFPQLKSLPTWPDRTIWPKPLWWSLFEGTEQGPPPVVLCSDAVRVVIFCRTGFYGVTIPDRQAEMESPARTIKLGDYTPMPPVPPLTRPLPSCGYQYSALISSSQLTFVSHPWSNDDETKYPTVTKDIAHNIQGGWRILDIMSGRIIVVNRTIKVLDLTPTL